MNEPAAGRAQPTALSVLITVPWAHRLGGAEEMLCTFLEHVDRERFALHVVLLADGPLVAHLRERRIRATVIETGRLRQIHLGVRSVARLRRVIAAERPQVILSWTTKSHLYTAAAAILAGYADRLAWWQHGIPERDALELLAAILPARVIGCSSQTVASAQRAIAPWRSTVVVHPGIRPKPAAAPNAATAVRERLGIAPEARLLGLVGRIHPMKGQELFLLALKLLVDARDDVHGLLVGGDAYGLAPEYGLRLTRMVEELGLQHHLTMTGHVDDPTDYMAALDVLVCTSTAEPFGIVLLEAMSLGIPVVATPGGGPSEIIRSGATGLLSRERTAEAVADAIRSLLNDPAAAAALAAAARRQVERQFSAEAMTARIQALLSQVAQPAPAPLRERASPRPPPG